MPLMLNSVRDDSRTLCWKLEGGLSSNGKPPSVLYPCSLGLPSTRRNGSNTPVPAGCRSLAAKMAPLIVPCAGGPLVKSTTVAFAVLSQKENKAAAILTAPNEMMILLFMNFSFYNCSYICYL